MRGERSVALQIVAEVAPLGGYLQQQLTSTFALNGGSLLLALLGHLVALSWRLHMPLLSGSMMGSA